MQKQMTDNSNNTKRIAKNTLFLYVRMLFLMLISLYTSRVILNALGVEDYGIYNVVGGVVTMFTMLSGSLNAAISRFLTFELGTGNADRLKKVFSTSVTIQAGLAVIFILIAETVGLWFLNEKMVIPEERMIAANWCYQFSIITFAINLLSVPYNASIISHERMSAFAYISIFEAVGRLGIAWCITINPIDRLIFFGAMVAVLSLVVRMVYTFYCKRNFNECKFHFIYDKDLLKQLFSFAGWNLFGNSIGILNTQGIDILSNLFFGVGVNAARGIAQKVNSVMTQFVNNFMMAMNPQITKSYALKDYDYMLQLMYSGARLSCYLLLLFAIPIGFEAEYVLKLWLKIVPDYAVDFVRWTLASTLCLVVGNSILTALLATGKIKRYQIIISIVGSINLPITYVAFKLGFSPVSAYVAYFVTYFILIFVRYKLVKHEVSIDFRGYVINVVFRVIVVTFLASIIPFLILRYMDSSFYRLLINTFASIISVALVVMLVGLTSFEKTFVFNKIKKILKGRLAKKI